MNREEFAAALAQVFEECRAISAVKQQDYATEEDAFANFGTAPKLAHISLEKGIFIRMLDKVTRIGNLWTKRQQ